MKLDCTHKKALDVVGLKDLKAFAAPQENDSYPVRVRGGASAMDAGGAGRVGSPAKPTDKPSAGIREHREIGGTNPKA